MAEDGNCRIFRSPSQRTGRECMKNMAMSVEGVCDRNDLLAKSTSCQQEIEQVTNQLIDTLVYMNWVHFEDLREP
jgi:hypothetical protein